MNKMILPALGLVAALGVGGWYFMGQSNAPQSVAAVAIPAGHSIQPLDMPLGNPDARVVVVEYASLTCPHCANFHSNVFPTLKAEFVDSGQVLWLKREIYFDRFGLWGAMLARCGGEERYHGLVSLIYEQQNVWAASNDPAQVANNLRRLGRQAGMNDDQINACLEDADKALELTAFYQANAEADNVRATPSFFVNGQAHANMPLADFQRVIRDALGS